jgi:acetyl esterase/lipase
MKQTASQKSKTIQKILKIINFSDRTFKRLLSKPKRNRGVYKTRKQNIQHHLNTVHGFTLHTYQCNQSDKKHILFFHGGVYFAQANKAHRKIAETLVEKYGFKVSCYDYPLAPESQASFTVECTEKAYAYLCEAYPTDEFYLLGDSAGGGLAIVLLQQLRDKKITSMPVKTAIISPWVDVSMTNPEIDKYADKDVILSQKGLANCGKIYAGNLSINNPLVSPINAEMHDLGDVHIWLSDMELLYPDGVKLFEKMSNATGTTAQINVQPEMMHDWIVLPIPEAKETLDEIAIALQ